MLFNKKDIKLWSLRIEIGRGVSLLLADLFLWGSGLLFLVIPGHHFLEVAERLLAGGELSVGSISWGWHTSTGELTDGFLLVVARFHKCF